MPNWSGPMPDPVTSVRLPHSAPAPNASCMSEHSQSEVDEAPLQLFLGGETVVPGLRHLGHRRAGEMILPPALDQIVERLRQCRGGGGRLGSAACGGLFHGSTPFVYSLKLSSRRRPGSILQPARVGIKGARPLAA